MIKPENHGIILKFHCERWAFHTKLLAMPALLHAPIVGPKSWWSLNFASLAGSSVLSSRLITLQLWDPSYPFSLTMTKKLYIGKPISFLKKKEVAYIFEFMFTQTFEQKSIHVCNFPYSIVIHREKQRQWEINIQ